MPYRYLRLPASIFLAGFFALANFLCPQFLVAQPAVSLLPVAGGLTRPVDIVNAGDNSERIFVVEQGGNIKVFDKTFSYLGVFLAVPTSFNNGERGLLSLAFHPGYAGNGLFFVYYTNTNGDVEVARYHTNPATPNTADPASKQVVITIPHPSNSNHNGGKLNFGADGFLYFATGDGGGAGDVPNNAQNGTVLLGKMIRINVTTADTPPFYTIPADNPFLAAGDNIRDEIWAFGLRNPFRWSFDRMTHDMWIGDVGQDAWEEINFRPAGTTGGINYGWHCMEGTHAYNGGCTITGTYAGPLLDYPHDPVTGGEAVIGGFVYRGQAYPALYGYYIFADEVSANVWLVPPGGAAADTIEFKGLQSGITAFGESEHAELYSTTLNGNIYRVVATASALPVTLTAFGGKSIAGKNELGWTVAAEENVDRYDIEYAPDPVHFQLAGSVKAMKATSYHFTHQPAAAKLYYRLKIIDADNAVSYSKVISISGGTEVSSFVYPSPVVNGILTLRLPGVFSDVVLFSADGKAVFSSSLKSRSGTVTIGLPALAPGIYLVVLNNSSGRITQTVVIR